METDNINKFGNYIAEIEITYNGVTKTVYKTMWSESFTPEQLVDIFAEAYNKGIYVQGTKNTWESTLSNGMKVRWFNSNPGFDESKFKGTVKSIFPIY